MVHFEPEISGHFFSRVDAQSHWARLILTPTRLARYPKCKVNCEPSRKKYNKNGLYNSRWRLRDGFPSRKRSELYYLKVFRNSRGSIKFTLRGYCQIPVFAGQGYFTTQIWFRFGNSNRSPREIRKSLI